LSCRIVYCLSLVLLFGSAMADDIPCVFYLNSTDRSLQSIAGASTIFNLSNDQTPFNVLFGGITEEFYSVMGPDTPSVEDVPIFMNLALSPYLYDEDDLANLTYSISSADLTGVPVVSTLLDSKVIDLESNLTAGDLKRTFEERMNPVTADPIVINEAANLSRKYPGDRTIGQVCSIYEYLKCGDETTNKWVYVGDPHDLEYYRYPHETLSLSETRSGIGDCDDFAILMSALINSIGGETRIVLAYDDEGSGHVYSEVYLGKLGEQDQNVEKVILWTMRRYSNNVYCHLNNETNEVWLNLDWWNDNQGVAHPGGPFMRGVKHIVIYTEDSPDKSSINAQKPEKLEIIDIITSPEWENQTGDLNEIITIPKLLSSEEAPLGGLMNSIFGLS